uniref:DiGeorge syndrome critical region gene 6 n=1 Tax=Rhinopithecus roxellana TaxID=61622 RepID=A0A2K6QN03_RHIRO
MERYAGALEEVADGARQQERHYQLLSALQSLVKELPSSFQQRLSYTTLSDLALALLDGTVFEIVQGLLEIQHLTEKSLYNQRLRLQNEHRGAPGPPAPSDFNLRYFIFPKLLLKVETFRKAEKRFYCVCLCSPLKVQ